MLEEAMNEPEEPEELDEQQYEFEEEEESVETLRTEHTTIQKRIKRTGIPCSNDHILELLYVMNDKIEMIRTEMKLMLKNIDIKRLRKTRTSSNRCTYINRKKERCKGYFCTHSKSLCYAHYTIVSKTLSKSNYLYGSDKRSE